MPIDRFVLIDGGLVVDVGVILGRRNSPASEYPWRRMVNRGLMRYPPADIKGPANGALVEVFSRRGSFGEDPRCCSTIIGMARTPSTAACWVRHDSNGLSGRPESCSRGRTTAWLNNGLWPDAWSCGRGLFSCPAWSRLHELWVGEV